jgi:hypothetical protein
MWPANCIPGRLVAVFLFALANLFAQAIPEKDSTAAISVRVQLLAPITTKFSRKGDLVSTRVLEPANYRGNFLEGEVHEVKGGAAGKVGYVQFEFHTLHMGDKTAPVSASLTQAFNSQRKPDVDEEGTALESNARTGVGKVFSRSPDATLRLAAKAGNVSFSPGSEFVLQMRFRNTR